MDTRLLLWKDADARVTWQLQKGQQQAFRPLHDML